MSRRLRASLQGGGDHVTFKRSFVVRYFNCHQYHHVGAVCVKCTVYTLQLSDFFCLYQSLAPTVFRVSRNFKSSRGICPFPHNFDISTELHEILQKLRND